MWSQRARVAAVSTLAIATCAVFAGPVRVAAEPAPAHDFTRDGWYLQAQGVYALEDFRDNPFDTENSWGFNADAGYRVEQLFALELEVEWIKQFGFKAGGIQAADLSTFSIGLPFRVYPLARFFDPGAMANRFQPFIKLAPAWQWIDFNVSGVSRDVQEGGFVGRMGGGLDIYLTDHIVLSTTTLYSWPVGDIADLNYWSFGAGLQYRFGSSGDTPD